MEKTTNDNMADALFRAFADRTRLRILHLLSGGELCVCKLVSALGVPQPKVSRHLAYLRRSDLVKTRKEGLWSYYRLTSPRDPLHRKLLDCLSCCFGDLPDLAADAQRMKKRGKCC